MAKRISIILYSIKKIQYLFALVRCFGLGWVLHRLVYSVKKYWMKYSQAVYPWDSAKISALFSQEKDFSPLFFFCSKDFPEYRQYQEWGNKALKNSDQLASGKMEFFFRHIVEVGFPPDWHKNYHSGQKAPHNKHWSRINDFDHGDIKWIWEPNRFAFSYSLVRAYRRTNDERYSQYFWQLLEDWRKHNPPNQGVNWKCGQEIGVRIMAWCFAYHGFSQTQVATSSRIHILKQMIAFSAYRIEKNIRYALRQQNNHGIVEGAALWTTGMLFPEFRHSGRWKNIGKHVLESQGKSLIYQDGAFSQHSMNYHRTMLHAYLWVFRLSDLNGESFSRELKQRIGKAADFLYQLQDDSGLLPRYGHSDGNIILPLSDCNYLDFRPVLQAWHYYRYQSRLYSPGPWDEDLLWLFGPQVLQSKICRKPRKNLQAKIGGYYTLRSDNGFAFIRCANFRHRPAQADMLHVDLWWRGQNIAGDAGTYTYNAPGIWNAPFAATEYHNTITINGRNQMQRASKFIWLPWLKSRSSDIRILPDIEYLEGEHSGYHPFIHRRAIARIGEKNWMIIDNVRGPEKANIRLHWLLADFPYYFQKNTGDIFLITDAGNYHAKIISFPNMKLSVIRSSNGTRGWSSPYYSEKKPALSVVAETFSQQVCFVSMFGPAKS